MWKPTGNWQSLSGDPFGSVNPLSQDSQWAPSWSNGAKPHEDTPGTVAGAYGVCLLSSVGLPTAPLSKVPDF